MTVEADAQPQPATDGAESTGYPVLGGRERIGHAGFQRSPLGEPSASAVGWKPRNAFRRGQSVHGAVLWTKTLVTPAAKAHPSAHADGSPILFRALDIDPLPRAGAGQDGVADALGA